MLFGSHARDQADAGSDYDVLVIEPEVADAAEEAVRLRAELGELLVSIDVVVVDQALAARRARVRGTLVESPRADSVPAGADPLRSLRGAAPENTAR